MIGFESAAATADAGRGGNAKDATPMGIRYYKPTSPGRRNASVSDFAELTDKNKKPEKSLTEPLKKTGGRNNQGIITARHRGGGHKRMYRIIDFRRNEGRRAGEGDSHRVRPEPLGPHRPDRSTPTARSGTSSPPTA